MENTFPDINLKTISQVTGLLCRAGTRIRQQENEEETVKKERIIKIKQKLEILESKYKVLKEKNKHNIKLDDLNIHLSLIKNRLEKISV
ncbi:MAG: hypothetical protein KKA61_01425 [Nanoarchaeota archaeon]|nr:hypothetical protein [Nanoarchaeota archaeon]MBU4283505.1 hypothetical protein [Nanoarchaeota archaeon]MBU4493006.1 hypothetical protein [Nanoarchaeota archaeon]